MSNLLVKIKDEDNVAIAVEGIMGTGLTGKLRDLTMDLQRYMMI